MRQLERPKSLTEMAADHIRAAIVNGDLLMGTALSEGSLAKELGISKTPVREALFRLRNEGLVTIVPQKGTFVFTADAKELKDICDLRAALETTALTFAVRRNADAFTAALRRVTTAMTDARQNDDTKTYLHLDTDFHGLFFDYCDNPYLKEAYRLIAAKMAVLRLQLGTDPAHMEKSYREHLDICAAVAAGQVAPALEILEGHIARKEGSYWNMPEEIVARRTVRT